MNIDCSICLDNIDVKVTGCTEMACGHKFHLGCIGKWLKSNNSCPMCRTQPTEKEKLFSEPTVGIGGRRFLDMFNISNDRININIDEFHEHDNNLIRTNINTHIINNANNIIVGDNINTDIYPNNPVQTEERDILLVMNQSGINNRPLVVDILAKNNGDIINAIMELTSSPFVETVGNGNGR